MKHGKALRSFGNSSSKRKHRLAHPKLTGRRSSTNSSSVLLVAVWRDLTARLFEAIEETNTGAAASPTEAAEVDACCTALERRKSEVASPTSGTSLSGTWKLVYTTEKDVHPFLLRKMLGLPVTRIWQNIDKEGGRLTNGIELAAGFCTLPAAYQPLTWDYASHAPLRLGDRLTGGLLISLLLRHRLAIRAGAPLEVQSDKVRGSSATVKRNCTPGKLKEPT
eukprot:997052-Pyramimonas_sp.AAC.1